MKKILIPIIVLLASALYFHDELKPILSKQVLSTPEVKIVTLDIKELVERKGVYFKKFSEVPFTGKVTGKEQGIIKNGKKEGSWVTYHENGQLKEKGNFKNGRWYGPWVSYWKNGQLLLEGTYENGFSNGPAVSYHKNGKLKYKGTFKNGEEDGPWVGYNEDGTVDKKNTGTFKNGKKISD
jgi:antitoxin component YwqK of YwqJK toxin-antitoxin module